MDEPSEWAVSLHHTCTIFHPDRRCCGHGAHSCGICARERGVGVHGRGSATRGKSKSGLLKKRLFLFLSQSKKSELAFLLHDGACATRVFVFPSQAAPHPDPAQNAANMREQFIDFIRRGKNPTLKCRKQVSSFFLKFCFLLTLLICAACRAP